MEPTPATPTEAEPAPSKDVQVFVANVNYLWKAFSVWIFALIAAAPAIEEMLPTMQLSPHLDHVLTIALGVLGIFARTLNQEKK